MNKTKILVFIGPSGSGKSTAVRALLEKDLIHLTPSWTTRKRREDEDEETVDHRFVSEKEFTDKAKAGYFIEEVALFGLPYRYGLPVIDPRSNTNVSTIMLRAQLLPLLSKHYQNFVTYQIEDSFERVSARLGIREKSGEQQGERLEDFNHEIFTGRKIANRVFINNTTVTELVTQIEQAISHDFEIDTPS